MQYVRKVFNQIMSQKKTDSTLPEIPQLTKEQLNRLLCADYLEHVAKLIRKGGLTGFDFAWTDKHEKPVGRLEVLSLELTAPLEARLLNEMEEARQEAARKIPVQDMTEAIQQHGKCQDPYCVACNNPIKA